MPPDYARIIDPVAARNESAKPLRRTAKNFGHSLIQSASYPRSASSIDPDLRRDREGVSLFIVDRHAPNVEDAVQQCLILGAASVGLCTPLIGCRSGGLGRP
jgi:hypothetical protein